MTHTCTHTHTDTELAQCIAAAAFTGLICCVNQTPASSHCSPPLLFLSTRSIKPADTRQPVNNHHSPSGWSFNCSPSGNDRTSKNLLIVCWRAQTLKSSSETRSVWDDVENNALSCQLWRLTLWILSMPFCYFLLWLGFLKYMKN